MADDKDAQEPEAETGGEASTPEQTPVEEPEGAPEAPEKAEKPSGEPEETETEAPEKTVPYPRFSDVIGKKKVAEAENAALKGRVQELEAGLAKQKAGSVPAESDERIGYLANLVETMPSDRLDTVIQKENVTPGEFLKLNREMGRRQSAETDRKRELLEAEQEFPLLKEPWFRKAAESIVDAAVANDAYVSLEDASRHVLKWTKEAGDKVQGQAKESERSRTEAMVTGVSGKGASKKSPGKKVQEAKKTGDWHDVIKDRVKLSWEK